MLRKSVQRLIGLALFVVVFMAIAVGSALAHVELESSSPADGETLTVMPTSVALVFSADSDPAGDGIILATADGTAIPATIVQDSPRVINIVPGEPLGSGVYGVAWTMKAGDAHPRNGTVTFRVAVPLVAEPETVPATPSSPTPDEEPLTPVFDVTNSTNSIGEWLARIGRWASMLGALVAVGAFAFAATSLIGTRREVEEAGYWVRRAGIGILAGVSLEITGTAIVAGGSVLGSFGSIGDAVAGPFGLAVLLRGIGGVAMLRGTAIVPTRAVAPVAGSARPAVPPAGGGVAVATAPETVSYRLDVHRELVAIAGLAAVVLSYLFDGHTVVTAPSIVVRLATVVHVSAAGVWLGGVLLMASTLGKRHRKRVPLGAADMALRFSRIASIALVSVAIAGMVLAVTILDNLGELFTTSWGRVLIAKIILVGAAASIGAFNHFRVIPILERHPHDDLASDNLRLTTRIEGGILVAIVLVTSVLVGAAS